MVAGFALRLGSGSVAYEGFIVIQAAAEETELFDILDKPQDDGQAHIDHFFGQFHSGSPFRL
jgi:hypothetical protein